MNNGINPFLTIGYISKSYFCNREYELKVLKKNIKNGINTTLVSVRRLGKSALIQRLFEDLEEENFACIYVDVYACANMKDFTETLAQSIFNKFPQKKGIGRRFFEFLQRLRPVITYDDLSGKPEIRFEFIQPTAYEHTLRSLFQFLDSQQIRIILAIDEFQQIADYPEKHTEALLRTIIQTLKHTQFIFSGSKKHMMLEMFNTANRPFFSSTQVMGLAEIQEDKYRTFIREKFAEHKRHITDEAIDFILSWTLSHTYYTQVICNGVFAERKKNVELEQVKRVCEEQLGLQQLNYMQYRSLLSPIQWQLLIAIAKEGWVTEPQAQGFLKKYNIGAASSAKKALDALLDKEMIVSVESKEKTAYRVYNVFLMRWLDRTF
ncbi:MAG: ATP-binding protein [Bacteroidetes bacterium]|nr:ATP-binding protein [Bacteroidota bacterium]MCL2302738.1 ATP-binding protein [Lentimicrobiaceae bacterium]